MKNWKKNMVAAAVLATVCAGIYVNWSYSKDAEVADLTDTLNEEKLMSTDMLVMAEEGSESTSTMSDYFAAVRLSRQQARDSAVTLLQEAMAYSEDAEVSKSNQQLEDLVDTALCEAQIESLVIAKGYTDCVAYIADNGISVAVASPEGGIQESDVAVVADIVIAQSDYKLDDIRVIEVQ